MCMDGVRMSSCAHALMQVGDGQLVRFIRPEERRLEFRVRWWVGGRAGRGLGAHNWVGGRAGG